MIMIENDNIKVEFTSDTGCKDYFYMTEDQFLAIEWFIKTFQLDDLINIERVKEETIETLPCKPKYKQGVR